MRALGNLVYGGAHELKGETKRERLKGRKHIIEILGILSMIQSVQYIQPVR